MLDLSLQNTMMDIFATNCSYLKFVRYDAMTT